MAERTSKVAERPRPESEAAELAAVVCKILTHRNLAAIYSGDLFDELRRGRDPVVYGFTPELQKLSVYQIFDRLNRACRLGLLARCRQPGGPVWWSAANQVVSE